MRLLLEHLFDIEKIAWKSSQIPNLIESVLSLNTVKNNRVLVFESVLRFFADLGQSDMENTSNTSGFFFMFLF